MVFSVREEKLWDFFSKIGEIKRVILGINRINFSPCGFCFIEFCHPKINIDYFINTNGLIFNGRPLKIDLDPGFREGRQFGRGKKGGQAKEELYNFEKKQKFLKRRV